MELWRPELFVPILAALAAGSLIGMERSFRARPAGFRTHALVSLASALLMVAAVHQMEWMAPLASEAVIRIDPVRMAHGILTGVGFLCGGVIFREGFSVHGLTTAASLWMTSALGVAFGVGFYEVAIPGTIMTVAVVAGFRWIDERLPQQSVGDLRVRYKRDVKLSDADLRAILSDLKIKASHISYRLLDSGHVFEHIATLRAFGRIEASELSDRLCRDQRVLEFEIQPRRD